MLGWREKARAENQIINKTRTIKTEKREDNPSLSWLKAIVQLIYRHLGIRTARTMLGLVQRRSKQ